MNLLNFIKPHLFGIASGVLISLPISGFTTLADEPASDSPGSLQSTFIGAGAGAEIKSLPDTPARSPREATLQEAASAFHRRDFESALKILSTAIPEDDPDPEIANMRGAALTELQHFDEARPFFKRTLTANPDHFWAQFNLAELELMEGKPSKARDMFAAMKPFGAKEDELLDLKIVLTYLKENNLSAAEKKMTQMQFPADSAAWYAAQSALNFYEGDSQKAHEWLAESERVFPGQLNGFLLQTLTDLGLKPVRSEISQVQTPAIVVQPDDPDAPPSFSLELRESDFSLMPRSQEQSRESE